MSLKGVNFQLSATNAGQAAFNSFNRGLKGVQQNIAATKAVSRSWNSADGERHSETEWFNVVAWGNLAEICKQYLVKGQQVYVEGRLQTRRWDDKEGQKHTSVEIVANEMMMLGDRRDANNNHTQEADLSSAENGSSMAEDEFPF